jgi:isocitrate dehydrogenase
VSIEDQAIKTGNSRAKVLAKALDQANGKLLEANKSPSRKVGELDNRGSHIYLALYWAQALASQTEDNDLRDRFEAVARKLAENEKKILEEVGATERKPVDIGGYYHPEPRLAIKAMRPSSTFNAIIDSMTS